MSRPSPSQERPPVFQAPPASGRDAFETLHPAVVVTYFAGVVVLTAFAMEPVLVGLSLAGALLCSLVCLGPRETARQLRWQLPAIALVCLANPLYSHSGATVVATLGPVVIRAEALAFGLAMGALLVATVTWLACAASAQGFDRMLGLGGGVFPTVSLMVSMALQLVPQLLDRARQVRAVEAACTAAGGPAPDVPDDGSRAGRLAHGARLSGVLMAWSMEESVGRADAMRARGWRAGAPRTCYRRERFGTADALAETAVALLLSLSALAAWSACGAWRFYPTMPPLAWRWGYVPYALLMALPTLRVAGERVRWARWEAAA